ncbi:MAG: hypothetical protein Q8P03_00895 [bacterium]|nr:hypothetical protein [bacterium]
MELETAVLAHRRLALGFETALQAQLKSHPDVERQTFLVRV